MLFRSKGGYHAGSDDLFDTEIRKQVEIAVEEADVIALDCARLISETNPSYVGLLTLLSDPAAPLTQDVNSGKFELLTPEEVLAETALMMQHIDVQKKCVFRSNHASNYVSLKGTLPDDKNRTISQLKHAMENTGILKDERFRMF